MNLQSKFKEYKKLRDSELKLVVETLNYLIENDTPFNEIVVLNPQHKNYQAYKEIVDALQVYHSGLVEQLQEISETLSTSVSEIQ